LKSSKKSRDLKRKLKNILFMNGENRHHGLVEFND